MNFPPKWFADELASLHLCFPGSKFNEAVPVAWWRVLSEFPEWAIRKALREAPKEAAQGQYLPSAENVRRIAEVLAAHPPTEHPPHRPQLPEPIAAGSLPETNPFMRLARQWEHESAVLGLDPEKPSPLEIERRRAAELNALLNGQFRMGPP